MKRTLWIFCVALIVSSPLAAEELNIPALPKSTALAGTLVYEGRWYSMGGKEIACVNKLLAGTPYRTPKNIVHESLPPLNNLIILWGQAGGRLVPCDVIDFDFRASWLRSHRKSDIYNTTGSKEYQSLRRMIDRIRNGKEHPLAIDSEKPVDKVPPAMPAH
jgi:hypothetical protein